MCRPAELAFAPERGPLKLLGKMRHGGCLGEPKPDAPDDIRGEFSTIATSLPGVRFSELFTDAESRSELVCTFLALLELIRLKQLVCVQTEAFDEIEIRRAAVVAPPAAESTGAPYEPPGTGPAAVEKQPSV